MVSSVSPPTTFTPTSNRHKTSTVNDKIVKNNKVMENFKEAVLKLLTTDPNKPLPPTQKTILEDRLAKIYSQFRTPNHPPYAAMIIKAVSEMNQKSGSSEDKISQFIQDEYKDLPWAHNTLMKHHLELLTKSGELIMTRGYRYSLPAHAGLVKVSPKKNRKRKKRWGFEKRKIKLPNTKGDETLQTEGVDSEQIAQPLSPEKPPGFEFVRVEKQSNFEESEGGEYLALSNVAAIQETNIEESVRVEKENPSNFEEIEPLFNVEVRQESIVESKSMLLEEADKEKKCRDSEKEKKPARNSVGKKRKNRKHYEEEEQFSQDLGENSIIVALPEQLSVRKNRNLNNSGYTKKSIRRCHEKDVTRDLEQQLKLNQDNKKDSTDLEQPLKLDQGKKKDSSDLEQPLKLNQNEKKDSSDLEQPLKLDQDKKKDSSDLEQPLKLNQDKEKDSTDLEQPLKLDQDKEKDSSDLEQQLKLDQDKRKDSSDLEQQLKLDQDKKKDSSDLEQPLKLNQDNKKDATSDLEKQLKLNQDKEKDASSDLEKQLKLNQDKEKDSSDLEQQLKLNQDKEKDTADLEQQLKLNQDKKKDSEQLKVNQDLEAADPLLLSPSDAKRVSERMQRQKRRWTDKLANPSISANKSLPSLDLSQNPQQNLIPSKPSQTPLPDVIETTPQQNLTPSKPSETSIQDVETPPQQKVTPSKPAQRVLRPRPPKPSSDKPCENQQQTVKDDVIVEKLVESGEGEKTAPNSNMVLMTSDTDLLVPQQRGKKRRGRPAKVLQENQEDTEKDGEIENGNGKRRALNSKDDTNLDKVKTLDNEFEGLQKKVSRGRGRPPKNQEQTTKDEKLAAPEIESVEAEKTDINLNSQIEGVQKKGYQGRGRPRLGRPQKGSESTHPPSEENSVVEVLPAVTSPKERRGRRPFKAKPVVADTQNTKVPSPKRRQGRTRKTQS